MEEAVRPGRVGRYNGLSPEEVEDQYRQLFREALKRSSFSLEGLARELDMGERNLQRILSGKYQLKTTVMFAICMVLGIDKSRACIAIERFGNWEFYDDPGVMIAVDLIRPVVENINNATSNSLEPLHPKATVQLSNWIAETVITHQSQVCARREDIEVTRQL